MTRGQQDGGARLALGAGVVFCGLAVALGAFGAHALDLQSRPKEQGWWQTAVQYQMFHGLALLVCGVLGTRPGARRCAVPAWSFGLGILLFSGTLYAMTLGAPRWFGAITPVGGVLMLVGWAAMLWLVRGGRPAGT